MTAGLFALSCPECGGDLATFHSGTTSTCAPCHRSFLNRFGHLIPVDFQEPRCEHAAQPAPLG